MAHDLQSPPETNMTELVSGILNDAQVLFGQQVRLVKSEIQEDFRKTKEAAVPMALGLWLAVLGSGLLSVTLALLLVAAGLPHWAAFAIVGAVFACAGVGLYMVGKKKFDSFNPLPDKSAAALQENLQWLAKPK